MNEKLELNKKILKEENLTCVICLDSYLYKSNYRGVKPLLKLIDEKIDVKGGSAADKVVGKAAAFLYVILGIKEVYVETISKHALKVFEEYHIDVYYDNLVDAILNRTKDGFCPMESVSKDENDPYKALDLIRNKLKKLNS